MCGLCIYVCVRAEETGQLVVGGCNSAVLYGSKHCPDETFSFKLILL